MTIALCSLEEYNGETEAERKRILWSAVHSIMFSLMEKEPDQPGIYHRSPDQRLSAGCKRRKSRLRYASNKNMV